MNEAIAVPGGPEAAGLPAVKQARLRSAMGRVALNIVRNGLSEDVLAECSQLGAGQRSQVIEVLRILRRGDLAEELSAGVVRILGCAQRYELLAGMPESDRETTTLFQGLMEEEAASTEGDDGQAGPRLLMINAADVVPRAVEWIWAGWLPVGKLVVLDGDPGSGKSTLATDWSARITTGMPFPGEPGGRRSPGHVLYLSAEDDLEDTLVPRLVAAGADLSRVDFPRLVQRVVEVHDEWKIARTAFSIPEDIPVLVEQINRTEAQLVVIDVFVAYLSGRRDSHRDQDMRAALMPLAEAAQQSRATVLLLRHLSKSGGDKAIYRGGGSIGIVGAARVGLLVAPHPSDNALNVLSVVKSNLAVTATSLTYRLVSDDANGCARIEYGETTSLRADDLLRTVDPEQRERRNELHQLLLELVADGPVPAKEAIEQCLAAGFTKSSIDRARRKLGISSIAAGFGAQKSFTWYSPNAPAAAGNQPNDPDDQA